MSSLDTAVMAAPTKVEVHSSDTETVAAPLEPSTTEVALKTPKREKSPVDTILRAGNLQLENSNFKVVLNDYLKSNQSPDNIPAVTSIIKGCIKANIHYIEPEFIPHLVRMIKTSTNPLGIVSQIVNENYLSSELKSDLVASGAAKPSSFSIPIKPIESYEPPKATFAKKAEPIVEPKKVPQLPQSRVSPNFLLNHTLVEGKFINVGKRPAKYPVH